MEKIYGVLLGFILGIIGMYIKNLIEKKLNIEKEKIKLEKLCDLVKESPSPNWIKTYTEPEIKVIYNALNKNTENIMKFKTRVEVIDAYTDEISKDIYSNLNTADIIRFNGIKFWSKSILTEINENHEKFRKLDFSHGDELSKYSSYENLSKKERNEVKKVIEKANKNQTNFENFIIETSTFFLMVEAGYSNMLESCYKKDFSKLEYEYTYESDEK